MPITTSYKAILPILNDSCVTFRGPSWWISEGVQVRSLSDSESRFILENAPKGFEHRAEPEQKAIVTIDLPKGSYVKVMQQIEELVSGIAMSAQATFNLVAKEDPLVITYGVIISDAYITRLRGIHEFDMWGDTISLRKKKYQMIKGVSRKDITGLFEKSITALNQSPETGITLKRFCSALARSSQVDRIVDLTIALESLIPGGHELRFRFPYYLSLLAEVDLEKRKEVYDYLQTLYDARCSIVHGSDDDGKATRKALSHWEYIVRVAKTCILYRLEFEASMSGFEWKEHLLNLAYGETPIIWTK